MPADSEMDLKNHQPTNLPIYEFPLPYLPFGVKLWRLEILEQPSQSPICPRVASMSIVLPLFLNRWFGELHSQEVACFLYLYREWCSTFVEGEDAALSGLSWRQLRAVNTSEPPAMINRTRLPWRLKP